ncbi:hypothetical protein [Glutamicibacter halophytocola]|uniref:hypothetical protein n=1 Tax=Glutamicibacter halophytocola TaxID=1933880 RepID=UPI0015C55E23|nr:hypothetical protein [Glutamicibacter halophytocola]NQD39151.1 hypothetical protein [Glutamicibacter halophytocola]
MDIFQWSQVAMLAKWQQMLGDMHDDVATKLTDQWLLDLEPEFSIISPEGTRKERGRNAEGTRKERGGSARAGEGETKIVVLLWCKRLKCPEHRHKKEPPFTCFTKRTAVFVFVPPAGFEPTT